MADLDALRPEVREAVEYMDTGGVARIAAGGWRIIRAELLRLTDDNARLRDPEGEWINRGALDHWKDRAERAEAELAALKARIAEAPVAYLTSKTGVGPCNVASMAHGVVFDSSSYGKSVRVVLDE